MDPVSPIYVADDEEAIKAPGEELATLVLQLKFTTAQVVRTALQELLGIAGAGNASGSVKIVTVPENETMLIRAKMRVLEHIQRVVKYIDVEVTGPDQSLSIRELYYADAQSIVSIVTEALSEFSPTGTTGRRTTPTSGQGANRGQASNRGFSSGSLAGESTRLIPDDRTQKIIIQSTDPDELDLVHQLIDELDTKVRNRRNTIWIYKVNYLKAEELADNIRPLVDDNAQGGRTTSRTTTRNRTGAGTGTGTGT